ncbi:MAG TPA: peptide chain release factor N(5)-glutamine methyltransferase [Anaerolineae bacterium]|nr:peptide chain release factor N(5)-glutamine methyltransferase [Anaerolineae bacterium]HQH38607.1 peptide chain release factor N(5)-glutamine methyltransferase [Anaerolineae bacterium]
MPLDDLAAALRWASALLASQTDHPHMEAELLLAHLLNQPRTYLYAHPEVQLAAEQAATYAEWVQRRAAGEPLPYIIGQIEFFGLLFAVTPDVLIPRPETETLVGTALRWIGARPHATAVDGGTGSGCIAVALAVHAPSLHLYATDISPAALRVARANAERHRVAGRITFLEGDWLTPLPQPADLVVSNPPYIAADEWDTLPFSVRQEPQLALLAGADGLHAIRRLLRQAPTRLAPGGLMLVEIGERQGAAALALARTTFPQAAVAILPDLAGKERVLQIAV